MPSCVSFNSDCLLVFVCMYTQKGWAASLEFFFLLSDLKGDKSYKTELGDGVFFKASTPGVWFWEKQRSQGFAFLSRNSSDKAFPTHLSGWKGFTRHKYPSAYFLYLLICIIKSAHKSTQYFPNNRNSVLQLGLWFVKLFKCEPLQAWLIAGWRADKSTPYVLTKPTRNAETRLSGYSSPTS